jgi:hypothetical protein
VRVRLTLSGAFPEVSVLVRARLRTDGRQRQPRLGLRRQCLHSRLPTFSNRGHRTWHFIECDGKGELIERQFEDQRYLAGNHSGCDDHNAASHDHFDPAAHPGNRGHACGYRSAQPV